MTPQVANQNNDVCPHKLPPHSWWQSPPTHHIAVGFYDSNKINAWYILNYSYLLSINIKGLVTVIHDLWLVIIDYPGGCPYAHVYVLQESPNKQKQLSLSVVYLALLMWPGWDIGHMTWLLKSLASTLQKSVYIYIHIGFQSLRQSALRGLRNQQVPDSSSFWFGISLLTLDGQRGQDMCKCLLSLKKSQQTDWQSHCMTLIHLKW